MFKILATTVALPLAAASAHAATMVFATGVEDYMPGTGITDPARLNTANAIGETNNSFLSLGLGGSAVFTFGTTFGSPGAVIEVTNGNRAGYLETADVYGIGYDGTISGVLESITNATATAILTFSGTYAKLLIVDTSLPSGNPNDIRDGFDIDSIKVSAVPLPAGGLLLIGAIGGLAALRRRKALAA